MNISAETFCDMLQRKLETELVGELAHLKMIPQGRKLYPETNENPKRSAVLILFYHANNVLCFPLIKRATNNSSHSGQMAFPGGKHELDDIDLIQTALREAKEEIGVISSDVTILGTLSEIYIGVTNFSVLPVVGFINYKPEFVCQLSEVDSVYQVKLNDLLNTKNCKKEPWNIRGQEIVVPYYSLANAKVWGATAMILSELETLFSE